MIRGLLYTTNRGFLAFLVVGSAQGVMGRASILKVPAQPKIPMIPCFILPPKMPLSRRQAFLDKFVRDLVQNMTSRHSTEVKEKRSLDQITANKNIFRLGQE